MENFLDALVDALEAREAAKLSKRNNIYWGPTYQEEVYDRKRKKLIEKFQALLNSDEEE